MSGSAPHSVSRWRLGPDVWVVVEVTGELDARKHDLLRRHMQLLLEALEPSESESASPKGRPPDPLPNNEDRDRITGGDGGRSR